ncbi:MAG: hypothetical protein JRI23_09490 [Deltaproteobacteria bacterium]|jgi:hypothetical protein|nr:hypothetical protein [Deltaproteobacteria bacterium]MBW2531882.1 hypothetical protein [Deltaproteobacteria bacterium]
MNSRWKTLLGIVLAASLAPLGCDDDDRDDDDDDGNRCDDAVAYLDSCGVDVSGVTTSDCDAQAVCASDCIIEAPCDAFDGTNVDAAQAYASCVTNC